MKAQLAEINMEIGELQRELDIELAKISLKAAYSSPEGRTRAIREAVEKALILEEALKYLISARVKMESCAGEAEGGFSKILKNKIEKMRDPCEKT